MSLQFALVGCLFLMAAINISRKRWLATAWNVLLGIALLLSTVAVILKNSGGR